LAFVAFVAFVPEAVLESVDAAGPPEAAAPPGHDGSADAQGDG
jgi:hypothetical protein